jgi:hypothetical protein
MDFSVRAKSSGVSRIFRCRINIGSHSFSTKGAQSGNQNVIGNGLSDGWDFARLRHA